VRRRAAAAAALLLALAAPAAAQQPPADIRGEFERLVSQIESLLDRSLEPEMRDALRKRLEPLVARLEAGTDDDRAGEAFRLERRLVRLRENRRGTFDNIPPALFEAYQRALEDEERRLVEALRALGRKAE
jgi:hypothetical protein